MTAHGQFHWNELMTRNVEQAKKFYAETMGWSYDAMPMPGGSTYTIAMADGKPAAGIFDINGPEYKDVPESWMPYIAVDNVDERVKKATKAGAKVMKPAFDVPNVGRIAILLEPGGAGIGWMTPAP
ncbi:MAG: VOC family protein [Xanthobacteraceae bacterium]